MYDEIPRMQPKPLLAFSGRTENLPKEGGKLEITPPAAAVPLEGSFKLCDGTAAVPETRIWVAHDRDSIGFWWQCEESETSFLRDNPNISGDLERRDFFYDRIEIFLDTSHDHQNFWQIVIDPSNQAVVSKRSRILGEDAGAVGSQEKKLEKPVVVLSKTKVSQGVWSGCCVIPFKELLLDSLAEHTVWGINFLRARTPFPPYEAFWSCVAMPTCGVPVFFGDLYFEKGLVVDQIHFPAPVYGDNKARITGRVPASWKGDLCVEIKTTLPYEDVEVRTCKTVGEVHDGRFSIDAKYALSDRGRWPGATGKNQLVQVRILDSNHQPQFSCSYPFSYDVGIIVSEPYGKAVKSQPRLKEDAYETKRRFILENIPVFQRLTTREGAPSDFTLNAEDDSIQFNLMDEDILDQIGKWLAKVFPSDTDRLLGAAYFIHQRSVTRHAGVRSPFVGDLSPETILRVGGSLCGTRSTLLNGLLSRTCCTATDLPFRPFLLGLSGHVVTAVEVWPGYLEGYKPLESGKDAWADQVLVLDPDVGGMFLTKDASRIATLAEMRHDRAIGYRANVCQYRHGHEFYFGARHQRLNIRRSSAQWPIASGISKTLEEPELVAHTVVV
jgi:hypothetical protein